MGRVVDDAIAAEFHEFFERHYAELSRLAYLLTGDADTADDLASDALLALWHRWDRVRAADHPVAYARGVVANLARSQIRSAVRERRRVSLFWSQRGERFDDPDVAGRARCPGGVTAAAVPQARLRGAALRPGHLRTGYCAHPGHIRGHREEPVVAGDGGAGAAARARHHNGRRTCDGCFGTCGGEELMDDLHRRLEEAAQAHRPDRERMLARIERGMAGPEQDPGRPRAPRPAPWLRVVAVTAAGVATLGVGVFAYGAVTGGTDTSGIVATTPGPASPPGAPAPGPSDSGRQVEPAPSRTPRPTGTPEAERTNGPSATPTPDGTPDPAKHNRRHDPGRRGRVSLVGRLARPQQQ